MKPNTRVYLILLAGFAVLLAGCQFPVRSPARVEQITSTPPQVESPLPVVTEGLLLDSASAYRVTLHSEVRRTQPDGSTIPEILEYNYFWTRSENPYGYNEHRVTTIVDPRSGTPGVMDEAYVVDDLAFTYCPTCPMITAGQTGWSVGKRSGGDSPGSARDVYVDGVSTIAGMPLAALVARSVVIGSEEISGIPATHYRLTDSQVLSEMVRIRTGGAPNTPLEVRMAQANIWLTVSDHQPIQYTFQAEGRTESIAGSQLLQPFTIHEQYSITEINGAVTITVPTAVLTAVGPQLKALETEPDATPVRPQQTYNQLRSPQVAMAPPTAVPEFAAEVLIPAGEFQMGCDASNSAESCQSEEEPLHTVILNAFSIDKYEVTNVRYQACVDAGRCTPPQRSSSSTRDSYYGTAHYADYPVANVTWNQALDFCAWAGKRLPTEDEWEKAARGTDGRIYPWGDATPDATLLNFNQNTEDTTAVGSYPSGASPYGVMDMAGNVWEWTVESFYYTPPPGSNPKGTGFNVYIVQRGGSWGDPSSHVRATHRNYVLPADWGDLFGFRCVH